MRRNTLIAILLSAAILIGYYVFFPPKPEPKPEEPAKTEEAGKPAVTPPATGATTSPATPATAGTAATVAPTTPAAVTPASPAVAPVLEAPMSGPNQAKVTTPLYDLEMVNGEVFSLTLKKYTGQARYNPLPFITQLRHASTDKSPEIMVKFDRPFRLYGETELASAMLGGTYVLKSGSSTNVDLINGGPDSTNTLVFERYLVDGTIITRKYTFHPDTYQIDLTLSGIPASWGNVALGLGTVATAIPDPDFAEASEHGYALYGSRNDEENLLSQNEKQYKDILNEKRSRKHDSENYSFAALGGRYFGMIVYDPTGKITATESVYNAAGTISGRVWIDPVKSPNLVLWAGPKEHDLLAKVDNGNSKMENMIDFGGWISFIGYPIFRLLRFFGDLVGNYGIAIIILTLISKILLWPLSAKSIRSSIAMQAIQPEMALIKEKYKDDKQKLNAETMELYKRHKINPVSGCLPLLIQMPIFFALYAALRNAVELRGAGFLYIRDLSEPDALFNLPFSIPIIGSDTFNLLPLLMLGAMIWQQKMTTNKNAPKQEGQGMMKAMPIIFGFMFYNMPSGLVIYWLLNTVLTVGQQFLSTPKIKGQLAAASGAIEMAPGSPTILKIGGERDPWITIWVPMEMPDKKYLDRVLREMAEKGSRMPASLIEMIEAPLSWRPDYSKRTRNKEKGGWEITITYHKRTR